MVTSKITISIDPLVDAALDVAIYKARTSKSAFIEAVLRKHLKKDLANVQKEEAFTAYAGSGRVRSRAPRRKPQVSSPSG